MDVEGQCRVAEFGQGVGPPAVDVAEAHAFAACFADIGVWNRQSHGTPRVTSLAGYRVHGGLVELIQQAHDRQRGFDVVVCTDESRLPRRVSEHHAVLLELVECGVRVVTLSSVIPPDFPGTAASAPHAWSSGLSDLATQEHDPMRHLPSGSTVFARGEAR